MKISEVRIIAKPLSGLIRKVSKNVEHAASAKAAEMLAEMDFR
jgi:hypothetical protein